jgi:glycosyltransferase involved in cell wall biosynthesis
MTGVLGRLKARLRRRLRHQIEAVNLRRSRRVIVLSQQSRGEVRSFGFPEARIRKAAGGVDVARFLPSADKRAVRRALGVPEGRCLLLSVRRLAPRMGLENLIRAMPQIVALRPDALLLIGGQGPERERLQHLIGELRLDEHVRLVGFIPDARLAAYYQASDLFVLPTLALEGFGLVTTEALACGVPVVGTPVGATPELLAGLDTRLVAPGVTPDALVSAVLGFLEGDWKRELTPERLRRHVLDHYTWGRHVDAVEAVYGEVIGEAGRKK